MVHHRTAEVRAAGIQQQAGAADLQGDALGVEGQAGGADLDVNLFAGTAEGGRAVDPS